MNTLFSRLIASLLTACLVVDPGIATGMTPSSSTVSVSTSTSGVLFAKEAFAARAVEAWPTWIAKHARIKWQEAYAGGYLSENSSHAHEAWFPNPNQASKNTGEGGSGRDIAHDSLSFHRMFGDSTDAVLAFLEIPHLEDIGSFSLEVIDNRKSQVRLHTVTFRSGNLERTVGFSTKAETIERLADEFQATLVASKAQITPRAEVISGNHQPVLFQLIRGESHVPFEKHPRLLQMAEAIGRQLGHAHAMRLVHDDLASHLDDHVFFEFTAAGVEAYFIDWGRAIQRASNSDIQAEKDDVLKHILRDSKVLADTSQQNAITAVFNHGYDRARASHTEAAPEISEERSQQLISLLTAVEQASLSNPDLIRQKFREAEASDELYRSAHMDWTHGPYLLLLYFTLAPMRRQSQPERIVFYEIERTDGSALTAQDRAILSHFFFTLESNIPSVMGEATTFKPLVPRDPSKFPHRMQASVDLQDIGIPAHHPLPELRIRIRFVPPANPWGEPPENRRHSGGIAALKRVILPAVAAALNHDRQEIDAVFQAQGHQMYGLILSMLFALLIPGVPLTRDELESLYHSLAPNAPLRKALEPFLKDPSVSQTKFIPSNRTFTPRHWVLTAA